MAYKAADGYHELPVQTSVNGLGQTVIAPAGGIGIIDTKTGQRVPTTTKYVDNYGIVKPNYGTGSTSVSGSSSILGGGTGTVTAPAVSAKTNAQNAYQGAIDTANTALGGAQDAAGKSEAHITNAAGDLGAARTAANGIGTSITNINAAAAGLAPYAQTIAGQGGSLLDLYNSLIGGDPSVGGIAGDYLGATRDAANALAAISPDLYALMAGADVRNSYGKALDAQNRDLARRGVSAGSGAAMSLNDQFKRALATAEASAMTRARQQGISDRANALSQRAGLYQNILSTAQSAGQQGTQDFATAAGIIQKQGDLFSTAGSLGATQTNAYANIGGVEVNLGNLDLSNEKLVQDAYQSVVSAQQAMAKFYQDTMTQVTDVDVSGDDKMQTVSYR